MRSQMYLLAFIRDAGSTDYFKRWAIEFESAFLP